MADDLTKIAERLLRIIPRSSRDHLIFPASEMVRKPGGKIGKKDDKSIRQRHSPLSLRVVLEHLRGETMVGIVPVDGDMATSLHIDVDVYQLSHRDVAERIARLGLPLIVERSKSGGAHLSCYLREPMPAARVRAVGLAMLAQLGLSQDTEVFPKQDSVEQGRHGNGIFLPYFNVDREPHYAVSAGGRGLSVDQWLDLVEQGCLDTPGLDLLEQRLVAGIALPDDDASDSAVATTQDTMRSGDHEEARDHLTRLCDRLRAMDDGRVRAANSLAFQMGFWIRIGAIERETVERELMAAAVAAGKTEAEVRSHLSNGIRDGIARARRPAGDWPGGAAKGRPHKNLLNTIEAIRRLGLEVRHDIFRERITVEGTPVQQLAGGLTDVVELEIRRLIEERFRLQSSKEMAHDAIISLATEHRHHPVRDYLDSMSWDGQPRVERMLIDYFGAVDDSHGLNRAISRIMMVGAVRRVRHPGVKFDTIVTMEGRQGTGKSTGLSTLARDFYSDSDILNEEPIRQIEQMEGVWLYEIGEIEQMRPRDRSRIKTFVSRQVDRARMAYGRNRSDRPRQLIFVGTTNEPEWLVDETGNRRFLPVKTSEIDLVGLDRDRDQLWAEAAHMEAAGASITLPRELWAIAAKQQQSRMTYDDWMDILRPIQGELHEGRMKVPTWQVYKALGIEDAKDKTDAIGKRITKVMRRLGWEAGMMRLRGYHGRGFWREPDQRELPLDDGPGE